VSVNAENAAKHDSLTENRASAGNVLAEALLSNHNVDKSRLTAIVAQFRWQSRFLLEMLNMGHVTRKQYTRPLPDEAKIVAKKGGNCAEWIDRNEKKCSAPVMMGRDGKPRIRIRSMAYTAVYRDGLGIIRQHATGCRSKRSAEMVLVKLEQETEKIRAGVLTSAESEISKHLDTPLAEHIANHTDHQAAKGVHPQRVKNTRSRLLRLAKECNLHRLSDITADAIERWLLEKAKYDERTGGPMGAGTRNGYREAAIGFGNWLVKRKRILANPLCTVPKADVRTDCRRKRRAMTEDELRRLLDATRRRPLEEAMTVRRGPKKGQLTANVRPEVHVRLERLGRERSLIYKTMALTGLRKNELATLTVECLELDADPPRLTLDPNNEKNREGNTVPLRSDLAGDLRGWLRDKALEKETTEKENAEHNGQEKIYGLPSGTLLFNVPTGLLRILDRDLKAACIPKRDSRGRTVDIHALRHTFGTMLSAAGVKPRTAQEVMRHSTLDLTMNVYTDPALLDTAAAVESLPAFPISGGATDGAVATVKIPSRPATIAMKKENNEYESDSPLVATLVVNTARSGQSGATPVKMAASDAAQAELLSRAVKSCYDNSKGPLSVVDNGPLEWSERDSNSRPLHCERSALPTELPPQRCSKCLCSNDFSTILLNPIGHLSASELTRLGSRLRIITDP